ncbi:MAG TPA: polysaccharide deacetylase family protein [Steroidobacteraceae bacterium]|nr:polysaccharide deacetylase family protein [Steroidobacteraceae bacterium]
MAEAAERLGLLPTLKLLHDRGRSGLTVLAYHRVVPTEGNRPYPLDTELISATPEGFEWQMEYLRRHTSPVSLGEALAHLESGRKLPPDATAVTFDDGFNDTYSRAFPIMRRHGIPATVFVTTGYIDNREPFWFELVAHIVMRVAPRSIVIPESPRPLPRGPSLAVRRRSLQSLLGILKSLPNERRTELLREWTERYAALLDPAITDLGRPLNWHEIDEMAAAGIEFGSHTVTHPNLTTVSDEQLSWELSESRRTLEQRLHREVRTLAYPIGTRSAYDSRVLEATRRCGFGLAASYVSGANWLNAFPTFEVRRQNVGLHCTPAYFRALVSLPAWLS